MTNGPWEANGNGIHFTVSRKVRMNENVSAREWWESRVGRNLNSRKTGRVRLFDSYQDAKSFADKLNKT